MKTQSSGEKTINITVSDFMIMAETSPLMKLAKFADLDKSIEPEPPLEPSDS